MNLSILQIIALFSSFLLFILGIVFIYYPHGKKTSNYLLGAFMISNAVLLGNFFIIITFQSNNFNFQIINNIGLHSYLLLAPLLYLYIISLCKNDYYFSVKELLHFLPFLVIVSLDFFITLVGSDLANYFPKPRYYFDIIYKLILYTQIPIYIFASFNKLIKYRSQLKELYSNLIKIDLIWVNLVLYFLIIMWLTDSVNFILNTFHLFNTSVSYYLTYQSISINLFLCISLIYKGMGQTTIPTGKLSLPKYVQNTEDPSTYKEYKNLLSQIMEKEKLYLIPELNLENLAKRLNISSRQLSQTIHVCFGQNFKNYINQLYNF